jgi:hypothetical protein
MFDFTEMQTVHGIWFVGYPQHDFLMVAWQAHDLAVPHARWRVRYYTTPDDPWDGQDVKHWYDLSLHDEWTAEELIRTLDQLVAQVREQFPVASIEHGRYIGPSSVQDATDWMMRQPWVHARQEPEEPTKRTS